MKRYRDPPADGPCRACGEPTPARELATYGKCESCWSVAETPAPLDERRETPVSSGHDGKRGWVIRKPEVMR